MDHEALTQVYIPYMTFLNLFIRRRPQQGSYRNLTVVFQTFPGQNYFFFSRLFDAYCKQDITKLALKCRNLLYNVFLYSNYRTKLTSNF